MEFIGLWGKKISVSPRLEQVKIGVIGKIPGGSVFHKAVVLDKKLTENNLVFPIGIRRE